MKKKSLHELTHRNWESIKSSDRAGCIQCNEEFDASEVVEWVLGSPSGNKDDKSKRSMVCPRCGVDACVVGDMDFKDLPNKHEVLKLIVKKGYTTDMVAVAVTTINVDHPEVYEGKLYICQDRGVGLPGESACVDLMMEVKKSWVYDLNCVDERAVSDKLSTLFEDDSYKFYGEYHNLLPGKNFFGVYTTHKSISAAKKIAEDPPYSVNLSDWTDLHPEFPAPIFPDD